MKLNYLGLAAFGVLSIVNASSQESGTTVSASAGLASKQTTPVDSAVPLGKPIEWDSPQYPKHALENKQQGTVLLKLTVAKDGKVKKVEAVSGNPELAESAIRSARKWLYVPYFVGAKPAEAQTMVSISFKISEDGRPDISATYPVRPGPPAGQIFKASDGVLPPRLLFSPDPEYSEEANKEKYEGTCVLALIVGQDGRPRDIKVARPLGKDLDEKAIEAVRQWRFMPAVKNGQPVSVAINVEVQFRLH
jgi:TonB family protein